MSHYSDDLEQILRDVKITLTDKILRFPEFVGQDTEIVSYMYFCPEVLVFSYDPPFVEERFLEAVLHFKYDKPDFNAYWRDKEAREVSDTKLLELAYEFRF